MTGKKLKVEKTNILNKKTPQSLIRSILPETRIFNIRKFDEGYNNDTYDVTLLEGHVVLKLIRNNTNNQRNELATLGILRKTKSHRLFPKVIHFDLSSKNPYVLLEYLEGVPLSSVFEKVNNVEQIMEQLGQLKATLNSKKYSFFGKINASNKEVSRYETLSEYFDADIQKIFQELSKDFKNEQLVSESRSFWTKNKNLFNKDEGPCLCHGDTSLSNILVKKSGSAWKITGLIDFEYAHSGGAASDLYSSPKSFLQVVPYLNSLEKGYNKVSSLPKNWKKILWFSIWYRSVQWLKLLPSMSWQGLSPSQEKERKQKLKNKILAIMVKAKFAVEGEN